MIRSRLLLADLHLTREAWTLWLSVNITKRVPLTFSRKTPSAAATANPSNSKMVVCCSGFIKDCNNVVSTRSLKQPAHVPEESKSTPPIPEKTSGSKDASTKRYDHCTWATLTDLGEFRARRWHISLKDAASSAETVFIAGATWKFNSLRQFLKRLPNNWFEANWRRPLRRSPSTRLSELVSNACIIDSLNSRTRDSVFLTSKQPAGSLWEWALHPKPCNTQSTGLAYHSTAPNPTNGRKWICTFRCGAPVQLSLGWGNRRSTMSNISFNIRLPTCQIATAHRRNAVTEAMEPNGRTACWYTSGLQVTGLHTTM